MVQITSLMLHLSVLKLGGHITDRLKSRTHWMPAFRMLLMIEKRVRVEPRLGAASGNL